MDVQKQLLRALNDELNRRQRINPSYSLRAFARFLGVHPSGLCEIINGKRKVTRKAGLKILTRVRLPEDTAVKVIFELKGKYRKKEPVQEDSFQDLEMDHFSLIWSWQYLAILTLSQLKGFESDPRWIAKMLGIQIREARKAVQQLLRMGLLAKCPETGQLKATHRDFSVGRDVSNIAIQRSHQQHLELAAHAIQNVPVDRRDFSFINIATNPEKTAEAKKMIRDFRRKLCLFLESAEEKTQVVRMGFQYFPLTTNSEEKNIHRT